MTDRQRLPAHERRNAILDAAMRLLGPRGWEALTINEILAEAGLSKGGFYHHFSSKDEVLKALVLRFVEAGTAAAVSGAAESGQDATDQLCTYLHDAMCWELEHAQDVMTFVRLARAPGNRAIFLDASEEVRRRSAPGLEAILSAGVRDGAFALADGSLTADVFLHVSRMRWLDFLDVHDLARGGETAQARALLDRRLRAEAEAYARLLGLPDGRIVLPVALAVDTLIGTASDSA